MNIWILKYGTNPFAEDFVQKVKYVAARIDQLKQNEVILKSINKFHFCAVHTPIQLCKKKYLSISEDSIDGYSGLMIGKTDADKDLRTIDNLNLSAVENYSGQFALFNISKNHFECVVDSLGFHKVFYFEDNGEFFISNSIELLKSLGKLDPDIEQILLDFITSRFGIYPGYDTLYKNVFTLPEYGKVSIINGELSIQRYKPIENLLASKKTFEEQLVITTDEFKTAAKYLRRYHHTVIGLSGGHDGRLMLNFFHKTTGLPLETMTYNRAGKLDFLIASRLSKLTGVTHRKFTVPLNQENFKPEIPEYQDTTVDPFYAALQNELKGFYKADNSYKVVLGGNGADTDWEFGENKIKNLDKSSFKNFIASYSQLITTHPLIEKEFSLRMRSKVESYFLNKYECFSDKQNFMQLLASAFFHLERFRGHQGIAYSQISNKQYDVFAPFAIGSFNQLVFLAQKDQLQRGLKVGIHYRISSAITNGKVPYAPILTAKNEFGNNILQKILNCVAPYLPKLIWKLNNGDTNTVIRRRFSKQLNDLSKGYILNEKEHILWDYIDLRTISEDISKNEYTGQYNSIATILKFINNN